MTSKLDEIRSLEAQLIKLKAEARAERLKEIKADVALFQFTAKELGLSTTSTSDVEEIAPVEQKTRKPIEIKYRHPDNPELTWTGNGRTAKWLENEINAGKKLADFLIKKQEPVTEEK